MEPFQPFLGPLIRLQELNLELTEAQDRLAGIPAKLKAIDDEQEAARIVIKEAKERHEGSMKSRRDHESQLQDLEGKIVKYNDQSRDVKTNEQYRAIMGEIQTVKDKIGEVEEKILLSMDEADTLEKEIGEAEKKVSSRKPEFDAKRKVLTDEQQGLEALRDSLEEEKKTISSQVRPDLMSAFVRAEKMRGVRALSRIIGERCEACSVQVRPALAAEVRKNDALHQCESCRRLLYWIPEAPEEKEAAGTEADAAPAAPGQAGENPAPTGDPS